MKKVHLIFLILMVGTTMLYLQACSKLDDFEEVVMIPDPSDPDLPIYSELGYNTVGAYYNNMPWTSTRLELITGISVYRDSLYFWIEGKHYPRYLPVQIKFLISQNTITNIEGLASLNNHKIDLSQPQFQVKVMEDGSSNLLTNLQGALEFKRCRRLIVDDDFIGVVVSGLFTIKGKIGSKDIDFSNGRFDILINSNRFTTVGPHF